MLLKFNNIRDLADARYAAAAMAEWVGFTAGYADSLPAAKIQEIIGWCAGPKLVLELAPGMDADAAKALLTVLPAEVLEADEADYERLKNVLNEKGLQWIVRGHHAGQWQHLEFPETGENVISRVDPVTTDASQLLSNHPAAISVNCWEESAPAMKDFEKWNTFFEKLEIF